MNQREALRETVRLAAEVGMPELPGSDVGLAHLRDMAATAEGGDFDEAKLGRWLGWTQCALVAANVGVTLAVWRSTAFNALQPDAMSAVQSLTGAGSMSAEPHTMWTEHRWNGRYCSVSSRCRSTVYCARNVPVRLPVSGINGVSGVPSIYLRTTGDNGANAPYAMQPSLIRRPGRASSDERTPRDYKEIEGWLKNFMGCLWWAWTAYLGRRRVTASWLREGGRDASVRTALPRGPGTAGVAACIPDEYDDFLQHERDAAEAATAESWELHLANKCSRASRIAGMATNHHDVAR
jgi:hypothetical protein